MTKRREPFSYHHTLVEVAAVIGWNRCAAICGVSTRSVRNWSDPECEVEIRMIDAERLDQEYLVQGGTYAPFHRLLSVRLDIARRGVPDSDLNANIIEAAGTSGGAVAALVAVNARPHDVKARRDALQWAQRAIDALSACAALLGGGTDR
ncbi:hypothetical protein DAH55_03920 [Sphingomonas koreensis]|uniref:hypothetical protein n=1 Tax=Sphingomonas koreensis TaxID=93064 RepID=UPI000ACD1D8D|nr:hypothetical protein [Sphingomonas koreensis]PJI89051.1 hypothetical protein BDW16_2356 [Sphingomonas koreensis]RSU71033.1 hypothetical protein DAH55_03920 [Sphingomonas koreensis]